MNDLLSLEIPLKPIKWECWSISMFNRNKVFAVCTFLPPHPCIGQSNCVSPRSYFFIPQNTFTLLNWILQQKPYLKGAAHWENETRALTFKLNKTSVFSVSKCRLPGNCMLIPLWALNSVNIRDIGVSCSSFRF